MSRCLFFFWVVRSFLALSPGFLCVASGINRPAAAIQANPPITVQLPAVRQIRTFPPCRKPIEAVLFAPNGRLFATYCSDETVRINNLSTGKIEVTATGIGFPREWNASGDLLVLNEWLSQTGAVRVLDAKSGKISLNVNTPNSSHSVWAWDSEGRTLAKILNIGLDGKVYIQDLINSRPVIPLADQSRKDAGVSSAIFANNHKSIIAGAPLKLFDATTGNLIATLIQPDELQRRSAYIFVPLPQLSSDTKLVVINNPSGVQLWDTATGELKQSFDGTTKGFLRLTGRLSLRRG